MTESNSVRVSLVQRTDFTTPAALNMLSIEKTGQSIGIRPGYQKSQTIRTDANVKDFIRLTQEGGGSLPMEFVFPTINEAMWYLLRAALRSTETAAATQVTGVTSTGNVLSLGSINVETGCEVGDVVRIRTSADVLVGYGRVTAIDAGLHQMTISTAVTIPNGVNYKVLRGARMKNGTSKYYFDMEVGRLDANLFELFRKVVVNGFQLNISDGGISSISFDLMAHPTSERSESASLCLGHTDPTVNAVMDALGVPTYDTAGASYTARSLGLSLTNNIRRRTGIKTAAVATDVGFQGYSWGDCEITNSVESYLQNFTEIAKSTTNQTTDQLFVMQDAAGQAVSFSCPRMKWGELQAPTHGLNQDDYVTGSGMAFLHPVELCSIRVQRWI